MEKQDMIITCKDCGKEFTFTVGEQEFYAEKGLNNPIRCKDCRAVRKAKYAEKNATQNSESTGRSEFEELLDKFTKNTVKFED